MKQYCPCCGKELPDELTRRTASRQDCPHCGSELVIDLEDNAYPANYQTRFCTRCGTELKWVSDVMCGKMGICPNCHPNEIPLKLEDLDDKYS